MANKVVHLPDYTHVLLKSHCEKQGIRMTPFIVQLIHEALPGSDRMAVPKKSVTKAVPKEAPAETPW